MFCTFVSYITIVLCTCYFPLYLYSDFLHINKSQGRYLMFAMEGGEIYTASVVDNINMICELYEQKLGQKDLHNLTF